MLSFRTEIPPIIVANISNRKLIPILVLFPVTPDTGNQILDAPGPGQGDQVDIIDETLLGLIFPQCLVNVDDLLCHLCAFHFNGKLALCVKLITHIPDPGELAVCSPLEFGRPFVA